MTSRERALTARERGDSTSEEFVGYGFWDAVEVGDCEGAERLLGAVEERILERRRAEEGIRRGSHTHRCTCPCACQESVECFSLPHRREDGPYCPDEALTFTCAACAAVDLCEFCGTHPQPGETFVRYDGDLMCPMCLEVTREHEEDATALVVAESTQSRLRSGIVVPEAPSHVLTLRSRMPAGYAECLRCARSIPLTDIGEPCGGDLAVQSGDELRRVSAAESAACTPRQV